MDTDLRIPLAIDQKALIDRVTIDEPAGKAEWARAILLAAAKRKLARTDDRTRRAQRYECANSHSGSQL
jgi:hypothetical protein